VAPSFVAPPSGQAQHAFDRTFRVSHFRRSASTVVILADPAVRWAVPTRIAHFTKATVYVSAPETLPEWRLDALGARHLLHTEMSKINWRLRPKRRGVD
jgi:hypothetical protein